MKEQQQRLGINPRIRPGENMPSVLPGSQLTRFHGELVLVTKRARGEPYVGKSPYTQRQLKELEEIRDIRQRVAREEAEEKRIREERRLAEEHGIRVAENMLDFEDLV